LTRKSDELMPRNAMLNRAPDNPLSRRRTFKQAAFEARNEPKMAKTPRQFARAVNKRPITLATAPFDWTR
jgi:hypothetical protein